MSQEIEIEFKNLLTKEEYFSLLNYFKIDESLFTFQENHYFDTNNFALKDRQSALRIRSKQDTYTLTLKTPLEEGLLETNQTLQKEEAEALLNDGVFPFGEVNNTLQSLGIPTKQLHYFGTLTTKRAEIEYKNGLLVFDASFYMNVEDYELEYEVKDYDAGQKRFLSLLEERNIPTRKTENKVKRFYNAKLRQQ
ncbi:CYTH domain-containing protein [Bacillus seohaeanensis]|uniref:CYTH domain-containing protein n=1 Tax=Bacillus seohaeanensis TaxID=284580 RepID=A0ABW5RQ25_9BACI